MQMTTKDIRKKQAERMDAYRRLRRSDREASRRFARESLMRAGLIDEQGNPTKMYR